MDFDSLLRYLIEKQGSDLHLRAGMPPAIRVLGDLAPIHEMGICQPEDLEKMQTQLMTEEQRQLFDNSPTSCSPKTVSTWTAT